MNDINFLNFFAFNEFHYTSLKHTDNSLGVEKHFLGFLKKGNARIVSDNISLELKEGDMFYIPKGLKYHSYWNTANAEVLLDSIGFLYFPAHIHDRYILQKIDYDSSLFALFSPLSVSKAVNCSSIGNLYILLSELEKRLTPSDIKRGNEITSKMLSLMYENPNKTIPFYAKKCGVSESLLYIYTKRELQKTPNRLRQGIACEKAIELLQNTTLPIECICDRCGFSSSSYFRKVLFSVTGKTPTQIRVDWHTI